MPKAESLFLLGLGPGSWDLCPEKTRQALLNARCIAGYSLYIDMIPEELKRGKRIIANGMRQERERCQMAIDSALGGEATALVCSGDAGIYAMASLVLEIMAKQNLTDLPLAIIPGIPALCAAAAAMGAPIGHDFACVSLSDLLTPLDLIFRRLEAAFAADFVVALYNPRSKGRPDYLAEAIKLARKYRQPSCPVGIARNVNRPGQQTHIATLADFNADAADMLSIIIICNSASRQWGNYMITPRGYARKI